LACYLFGLCQMECIAQYENADAGSLKNGAPNNGCIRYCTHTKREHLVYLPYWILIVRIVCRMHIMFANTVYQTDSTNLVSTPFFVLHFSARCVRLKTGCVFVEQRLPVGGTIWFYICQGAKSNPKGFRNITVHSKEYLRNSCSEGVDHPPLAWGPRDPSMVS
jgi:hypothetical protein